jgi:hypothetical protein
MASTTIKVSTETRDRIKALGGDTYEDTIVAALDKLEEEQFWAQAEAAAAWRRSLPLERLAQIEAREREATAPYDAL